LASSIFFFISITIAIVAFSTKKRIVTIDSFSDNNIEFLKTRDIIDEQKFQKLKNQLLGKENKSVGYSTNSN